MQASESTTSKQPLQISAWSVTTPAYVRYSNTGPDTREDRQFRSLQQTARRSRKAVR